MGDAGPHPARPGVIVDGTAVIEWLEGKRFLSHLARNDHPDFPDALSAIGHMARDRIGAEGGTADAETLPLRMYYFDSRGVFRVDEASRDDACWRLSRDVPGFSQRFTSRLSDHGDTVDGRWQLCRNNEDWVGDLPITYRLLSISKPASHRARTSSRGSGGALGEVQ